MRRVLAVLLVASAASLPACGEDDGSVKAAREQAEQTEAKAVRCSQRSFRVAFDPAGAIVVAAADDTLASLSETDQTVSGRCTIIRETVEYEEPPAFNTTSEKVTLTCNVREPADFVIRGTALVIAVRPQAIVTASLGDIIEWSNVCLPEEEPSP